MTDTKLPEWPDADWYRSYSNDDWSTYERARADAAMARLKYWDECVKAILNRIAGATARTERDELYNKLIVAETDLQVVLERIGPLPLPQMPTPLPGEGE